MARVHLVHWDPEDARDRLDALASLGHQPVYLPGVTGTPLMRALRASATDAFLIDLSRRPSHGREVAMALRQSPATRRTPIVFAGGEPDAVAKLRLLLPDATFTPWSRIKTAIPRALRRPTATPVVPPDAVYAGRTLAQKLGLAPREQVAAIGAPDGFAALLGPLPTGTALTAKATPAVNRFIWFVRTQREVEMALGQLVRLVTTQVVWLAWPKKASGVTANVDGNVVRDAGLAAGFVDYKVCSIDATWSGLAFKKVKR